jgi:hypothetical protein
LLSFSDAQLAQIMAASKLIPVNDRSNFLRSVAGVLDGATTPTNVAVADAITLILNMRGIFTNGFDVAPRNRRKRNGQVPSTSPPRF